MKKLFFYFSILISLSSLAQTSVYHPFPDSNAVWNVQTTAMCSTGFNTYEWNSFTIVGDTLIGGYIYNKIYIPMFIDSSQCWGQSHTYAGFYFGGIRQDTSTRTVYFIESSTAIEHLLYDFNLNVGDTMHGYLIPEAGGCLDDSIITEVDSILINGNYRKRWRIPIAIGPQYIIEGIGYTGGPFTPICSWFESSSILNCFTQENEILYSDTIYAFYPGLCGIINSVPTQEKSPSNLFYPDPVYNEAVFETSLYPATLQIYNSLGIMMFEQKLITDKTSIHLGKLDNGLYFYLLKNNSGESSSGKFVKE